VQAGDDERAEHLGCARDADQQAVLAGMTAEFASDQRDHPHGQEAARGGQRQHEGGDYHEHVGFAAQRGQAGAQVLTQAGAGAGRGGRGHLHRGERAGGHGECERVEGEHHGHRGDGQQRREQQRPDEERRAERDLQQAVRRDQRAGRGDAGDECVARGRERRADGRQHGGEGHQQREVQQAGRQEDRGHADQGGPRQIRPDHQPPAVVAVRERGPDQRHHERRGVGGDRDQRHRADGAGQRPGQPGHHGDVQAVAQPRDALAGEQEREVAVAKQCHTGMVSREPRHYQLIRQTANQSPRPRSRAAAGACSRKASRLGASAATWPGTIRYRT